MYLTFPPLLCVYQEGGVLTDLGSFYHLTSTVISNPKHKVRVISISRVPKSVMCI